jgi:glycosyltransferase involved in cell wall biosynthesis
VKIGLIITTYNWIEALNQVLSSIIIQSHLPDEVVICDDGSKIESKNFFLKIQKNFPCKLKYVWQQDNGFRAASIRNKGINELSNDIEYVVIIDGDMILHKNFIKDHCRLAKNNCFIQGGRAIISKYRTEKLLNRSHIYNNVNFFTSGISNRKNILYLPWISNFLNKPSKRLQGIRTCNMSFWKKDLYEVNGFDENFIGWGREDTEMIVRLFNIGKLRINAKFSALAFHLYHEEKSKSNISMNDNFLAQSIKARSIWCDNGLIKFKYNEN